MTNDKISIELSKLSNSLKNIGYNIDKEIYKSASYSNFYAWQKVIDSCIQPAPSEIEEAAKPLNEAVKKLEEEKENIDPEKLAEAADSAKKLKKMGMNLDKIFLKTFLKVKKESIIKKSSNNYNFDQREIFIFEALKEARASVLIKLNTHQIKRASTYFKDNDFSLEKTAGFWDSVGKGVKSVGKGVIEVAKVPLKLLQPVVKILPFAGLTIAVYMAVDGINGYINASKYIFSELGASSIGIGKWDIFSPSTMSKKVQGAIDSELSINIPDSKFPSCGEASGKWKCHWYYNPRDPERLSWGEFKKDLSDTFTTLKKVLTGQQIEQYIPDTSKSGTPRSFTRITADPESMNNLAKLAKCIEAMIIHITVGLDGLVSAISSIIAIAGTVWTFAIAAPALAIIDTVIAIVSATTAYAARKILAKDIRASIEVIMSTAQEGSQRCYMMLLSPSVSELNALESKEGRKLSSPLKSSNKKNKKEDSDLLINEKSAKININYLSS